MPEHQQHINNGDSGVRFSHSIPTIGTVTINLNGYPQRFYQIMERQDEINRLRKLEHLGVLQVIFSGIRHTRWDYTVTMLYLIQRLSEAKPEGFSSAKKVAGVELSGRDMMQLLALAANIGHLPGTFTVEKGLMRYLIQYNEVANKLIQLAEMQQDEFERIDYINLNKMLVLVKLQWWLDSADDQEKALLKAIKELVVECFLAEPTTEHREKIIDYFNLVRRISYQLLDCLYVNLPLRIDYSEFINRLPSLTFRGEDLKTISDLIDHYTRIVYRQIYHSDKARKVVALCAAEVSNALDKSSNALAIIQEWLRSSQLDDICAVLSSSDTQRVFFAILPHEFWPSFLTESIRKEQVEEIEVELAKLISPAKPVILYIRGLRDPILESSTAGELVFDVYLDKANNADECFKTLGLILAWLHRKFNYSWGIGRMVKAAMENILLQLALNPSDVELSIKLAPDEFFRGDYFVPEDKIKIFHANQRKDALQMFCRENKNWDSHIKEQFNECKTLKELMKRKWMEPSKGEARYYIIVPGRIKFRNKRMRKDICEFDGAFLTMKVRRKCVSQMVLFLIEAKRGRRPGESAEKELGSKLHELGLNKYRIRTIAKKNAYAEIILI